MQNAKRILFCHGVEPLQSFFIRRFDAELVFLYFFRLRVPDDLGGRQYC